MEPFCCDAGMDDPTDSALEARYSPVLMAEQAELAAASDESATARKPVELDQQMVGRLSRMDALQNQAMAQGLETRRIGRVRAINAALARIEDREFGFCEDCGDFIGFGRLDANPCVTRCVSCAT